MSSPPAPFSFLSFFLPPFLLFDRAAGFLPPRPLLHQAASLLPTPGPDRHLPLQSTFRSVPFSAVRHLARNDLAPVGGLFRTSEHASFSIHADRRCGSIQRGPR